MPISGVYEPVEGEAVIIGKGIFNTDEMDRMRWPWMVAAETTADSGAGNRLRS